MSSQRTTVSTDVCRIGLRRDSGPTVLIEVSIFETTDETDRNIRSCMSIEENERYTVSYFDPVANQMVSVSANYFQMTRCSASGIDLPEVFVEEKKPCSRGK